jgi:hypothetical protein
MASSDNYDSFLEPDPDPGRFYIQLEPMGFSEWQRKFPSGSPFSDPS